MQKVDFAYFHTILSPVAVHFVIVFIAIIREFWSFTREKLKPSVSQSCFLIKTNSIFFIGWKLLS